MDSRIQDTRPPSLVVAQFTKIHNIKKLLVRQGVVDKDGTARDVITALRSQIPPDLFDPEKPG